MDYKISKEIQDLKDKIDSLNLKKSKLEQILENSNIEYPIKFENSVQYISDVIDRDILTKLFLNDLKNIEVELDKCYFDLSSYRMIGNSKYGNS